MVDTKYNKRCFYDVRDFVLQNVYALMPIHDAPTHSLHEIFKLSRI